MSYVIDVHGLSKYFGKRRVVNGVDISVKSGHVTGFLGPNGSGKTTTLRMLCGLLTPSEGEGTVLGMNFRKQSREIKCRTGYMTQKFSLYEDMTIFENLLFMARVHELQDRAHKINHALERLGLFDRRNQLAGALSGGWKQRLALAVATLHEPDLLLLDEPTAGVDPKARREFWDEIHELSSRGLTVLVSTHYMDEAERCHDIGYILNGELIARGTQAEVIAGSGLFTFAAEGNFGSELVRRLSGMDGVLRASAFGTTIHVSGTDKTLLGAALGSCAKDLVWRETKPTLEDVFIQLMQGKKDERYR